MSQALRCASSTMAILAAMIGPVLAQTAQTTAPLVVQGERKTQSITVPDVAGAQEEMRLIPGGSALVPSEVFRDGVARTIKDALDFVPGVYAQSKFGQEDSRLSIRGSGIARNFHLRGVMLMQDGIPVISADGSGDFQDIDPMAARYVEVYKGANALRFGSTTLGGAINFVSPTGYDAPKLLLRGEYGSFNTKRSQIASGQVFGPLDYYATVTYNQSEGYRDHTDSEYGRFNGNVGYRFNGTTETRFFYSHDNIDQSIPGALTKTQALTTPKASPVSTFTANTKRDIVEDRLMNKTSFVVADVAAEAGVSYVRKKLFHPLSFGVVDNLDNEYGAFLRGTLDGAVAGKRDTLVVGVNAAYGHNQNATFVNNGGLRGALTNDVTELATNVNVYAENRYYVVPTVSLITGLQLVNSTRELQDNFTSNGNDSGERAYFNANPKLGAIWDVTPAVQLFGNVSRNSEPPTFSDLNPSTTPGFASLKSQTAWTFELGTRGSLERLAWDVSVYRAHMRNELQNVLQPNGVTVLVDNLGKTIHQGIEAGFDVALLKNVAASGGDKVVLRNAYTFSDFRFDGDRVFGDNQLPGVPRHYYRGELRYTAKSGFYFGPNVEWSIDSYFVDNANLVDTPAYAIYGFKAGYDFGNGLNVFADGRNLANKTYISNVSVTRVANAATTGFNPGDGRAIYVGAEWRW